MRDRTIYIWGALAMTLLFLILATLANASTVPPMPVIRPAPLQSPRAASVPKSTPMFKPASIPVTEPAPAMTVTVVTNINFLGCDPLEPGCEMFFSQHIKEDHPAGAELSIYMKDRVNASGGYRLATFGAASFPRVSEFRWYQEMYKFPPERYFFSMKVYPIVPASRTAVPIDRVNRELKYADAWSTPKAK